jgi:hypothetical protein
MGPYAGVDFNLTLYQLLSRLQHIYHGQQYARVDLNPMPESTLSPSQGLWIWPQAFGRTNIHDVKGLYLPHGYRPSDLLTF